MISNELNLIDSISSTSTSNTTTTVAPQLNTYNSANAISNNNQNANVSPTNELVDNLASASQQEWSNLSDDPFASNNFAEPNAFDPFNNNNSDVIDPFTAFDSDPFTSSNNNNNLIVDPFSNSNEATSVDPWANFGNAINTFDDAFENTNDGDEVKNAFGDDTWNVPSGGAATKSSQSNGSLQSVTEVPANNSNNWALFDDG